MASTTSASVARHGAASASFTAQASLKVNGFKGASSLSLPARLFPLNSRRLRVSCEAGASPSVGNPDTLKKVMEIVSKQLATAEGSVHPHSKFQDLGADSLDQVEIVMALEEEFKITVDEDGAGAIVTVQDAADLIEKVISKV